MKTLFVISDTHGNTAALSALKEIMGESDYIVHLGDYDGDVAKIKAQYPEKVISVRGNCDGDTRGDGVLFCAEGLKILAVHGHRFGVKEDLGRLCRYAREKGADIVLYGHTHRAHIAEEGGVLLITPGSAARFEAEKSYAYLVLHEKKKTARIVKIKEKFL